MMELTREIRFCLNPAGLNQPVTNSWAGWPSLTTIAPWLKFRCTVSGTVDPVSGYLCNIKLIDDAIRQAVLPGCQTKTCYWAMLFFAFTELKKQFADGISLSRISLHASPTLSFAIDSKEENMLQMTQQFEFSASHRLHNTDLSEQENRELFGKCNNPHGHGHNYVVEVTVAANNDSETPLIPLQAFETLVKEQVIDPFDHRYLNLEVPEFSELNPSVENIALVIWNKLESQVLAVGNGASRLANVRVYETPKTWADYAG